MSDIVCVTTHPKGSKVIVRAYQNLTDDVREYYELSLTPEQSIKLARDLLNGSVSDGLKGN